MAAIDPLVVFDVSFVLSAAATAGILALARPLGRALADRLPRALAPARRLVRRHRRGDLAVRAAPRTLRPDAAARRRAREPRRRPAGRSRRAARSASSTRSSRRSPPPSAAARSPAAAPSLAVRAIARGFTAVPLLALPVPTPTPWQLGVLAVVAIGWALAGRLAQDARAGRARRDRSSSKSARGGAARPRGALRVTFLDVGQGDAALVDLPDGGALLDRRRRPRREPGRHPGARVVAPVLRARRRSALDCGASSPTRTRTTSAASSPASRAFASASSGTPGRGSAKGRAEDTRRSSPTRAGAASPSCDPTTLCGARMVSGRAHRRPRAVPGPAARSQPQRQLARREDHLRPARVPLPGRRRARRGARAPRRPIRRACARTSSRSATTGAARRRGPRSSPPSARGRGRLHGRAQPLRPPPPGTLDALARRRAARLAHRSRRGGRPSTTDGERPRRHAPAFEALYIRAAIRRHWSP